MIILWTMLTMCVNLLFRKAMDHFVVQLGKHVAYVAQPTPSVLFVKPICTYDPRLEFVGLDYVIGFEHLN